MVPINAEDLASQEKEKKAKKKAQEKEEHQLIVSEQGFIKKKSSETSKQLNKRYDEIKTLIANKQKRSKEEFDMKKDVLQNSFKASVDSLIRRVRRQKELITSSYGPVVLNSKKIERPIFDINPDLDLEGHQLMHEMNEMQDKVEQTILVKIRTVRCLKDKISSGQFLVIVHALDRIGGNRIPISSSRVEAKYNVLAKNLREFAIKKRTFLNQENR